MNAYYSTLIRAAIGALFVAGGSFFALAPTQGPAFAIYSAGGAFCLAMVARVGELSVDMRKGTAAYPRLAPPPGDEPVIDVTEEAPPPPRSPIPPERG